MKETRTDRRTGGRPGLCVSENYILPIVPVSRQFVLRFGVRGLRVIVSSTCEFRESGRTRAA